MATFALAGSRKGLFDSALRQPYFLRNGAPVKPRSKKQRYSRDRRTDSNLHTDRASYHHLILLLQEYRAGCSKRPSSFLVYLVYLVCLVYLVDPDSTDKPDELNQPDKQNTPDQPDKPGD
jgi:hypothetical protein